ncbi:MAG: class I fructose-bisphosphate aldolase, partial [Hyphomicrobium sp.]
MTEKIEDIARALVAPGKGILAADESSGTIKKRFDKINTVSTEDSRRDYREMLFRSTDAMKNYVSGVILYDETIRQKAKDGSTLVSIMQAVGSIPGIKVDMGAKALAGPTAAIETVTEGLDGLRERLVEYHKLG